MEQEIELGRRSFVGAVAAASVVLASSYTVAARTPTIILDNVGADAWKVTKDTAGFTEVGEDNPELTLAVGSEYRFGNEGWSTHPFELRDAESEPLLSQDGEGSFEDDADVGWQDDGERFRFTVTEELAGALDSYACTVHPSMAGQVATTDAEVQLEEEQEDEGGSDEPPRDPELRQDDESDGDGGGDAEDAQSDASEGGEGLPGMSVIGASAALVAGLFVRAWRGRE